MILYILENGYDLWVVVSVGLRREKIFEKFKCISKFEEFIVHPYSFLISFESGCEWMREKKWVNDKGKYYLVEKERETIVIFSAIIGMWMRNLL